MNLSEAAPRVNDVFASMDVNLKFKTMSTISPLAYVHPEAQIGNNVTIMAFAYIDKNTVIGDGCVVRPHVSILDGARIGKNNQFFEGCIIAPTPQDFRWKGQPSFVTIGDNNIIREHVIINRSIYENEATSIGNHSLEHRIPVISSMGAGGRVDPTRVGYFDISETRDDGLARVVRQRLRKAGFRKGLRVVASTELPRRYSVIPLEEMNKKSSFGTIATIPAIFGIYLANYVITRLANLDSKK